MVGMHVALKIKILSGKCCIYEIEQDGKFLFTDIYKTWMTPEYFVRVRKLITSQILSRYIPSVYLFISKSNVILNKSNIRNLQLML